MAKNKNSAFTKTLWPLLDEYVTRQHDRDLLNGYFKTVGLDELPTLPAANDPSAGAKDPALRDQFPRPTSR